MLYVSLEGNVMSVEVKTGAAGLEIRPPKVLFNATIHPEGSEKPWVALVANWAAGLAQK